MKPIVRMVRRGLIWLREHDGALGSDARDSLERVLDAWDEFEYAAGTVEGGEKEVVS
jgi:hypothetical protein